VDIFLKNIAEKGKGNKQCDEEAELVGDTEGFDSQVSYNNR
jgi:hypothetical protein